MNKFGVLMLSGMMLLSSASLVLAGEEVTAVSTGIASKVIKSAGVVVNTTVCWPSKLLNKIVGSDKFGLKTNLAGWVTVATLTAVAYKLYSDAKKAELRKKQRELLEMLMAEFDAAIKAEQEAKEATEEAANAAA